jgi:hypothetical protein
LKNEIIAIDAFDFKYSDPDLQYTMTYIDRELTKLSVDLNHPKVTTDSLQLDYGLTEVIFISIRGCSVFLGDRELKSLLQLMAASQGHRKGVVFFTYEKKEFKDSLDSIYKLLIQSKITVGQLYKFIIEKPNDVKLFNHIEEEIKKIEIRNHQRGFHCGMKF